MENKKIEFDQLGVDQLEQLDLTELSVSELFKMKRAVPEVPDFIGILIVAILLPFFMAVGALSAGSGMNKILLYPAIVFIVGMGLYFGFNWLLGKEYEQNNRLISKIYQEITKRNSQKPKQESG